MPATMDAWRKTYVRRIGMHTPTAATPQDALVLAWCDLAALIRLMLTRASILVPGKTALGHTLSVNALSLKPLSGPDQESKS